MFSVTRIALTALALIPTVAVTPAMAADNYPSKPARLILPFGAGASTDIIGRIFAQRFSEAWGQTLVVDNRPGAGGILGSELAARSAPDGYTIFTYGINQTITPHLYKKLSYDSQRDFVPVSLYATMPNILCVNLGLPVTTVGEFIKHVRANPGKLNYGSGAISGQVVGEQILLAHGGPAQFILYNGGAPALQALLAGTIDLVIADITTFAPGVRDGRLRGLAVSGPKRSPRGFAPTRRCGTVTTQSKSATNGTTSATPQGTNATTRRKSGTRQSVFCAPLWTH